MIESKDPVQDSRVMREALALRQADHEVSLLAWDRTGKDKPYIEHLGVPIHRIPTRGFMRALGTDLLRNPVWWRKAYRFARQTAFDVVHCHDLDTLPIGVRLKRKLGKLLVYDCHEMFGYMIEEDVPRAVSRYAFRMEKDLAPHADRVITVTDDLKAYLDAITGKEAIVVRNCAELMMDEYVPPPATPFTILYIGDLHPSRFLLPAIEVIGGMSGVRLAIGGTKRLTPVVQAKCAAHSNTEFLGAVPNDQVPTRTFGSHAVLSMLDPTHRSYQVALSTKIFEAMVAGRPSINTKGLPSGALVEREECGLSVPYTQEGFRAGVERLHDDPQAAERLGRRGLAAAKREYNWGAEKKRLVALYEDLSRR